METILGVVVDELSYLENPLVETPTTVNTYRSALISAMSRADRVVLTRPGAELVAENVITVPIPCQPFVVEHLGKKHGDYVPRCRMRPGQVHVRLTTGQVLTDVQDISARLQAVHHLISRHDILLELEELQAVTHMVGKEYRIGDRSFRPRQVPLRLNGAPAP